MVMTTRASRTASEADPAIRAPASANGVVAAADLSHTVVGSPAASRLRAIAEPMMPIPTTAAGGISRLSSVALMSAPRLTGFVRFPIVTWAHGPPMIWS